MKKNTARLLSALCVLALLVGLVPMGAAATAEHTIWLVGDSTVCDYAETEDAALYYKRCGYGTKLRDYVDATYQVTNLAVSGQSSKSFPTQQKEKYDQLTAGIRAGDVLIIGFGHNDEKAEDTARYTAPNGTSTTEGSFAKSLTDNYIKVAKDAGATPILCTPIVRRTEDAGKWGADKLHQANGGDYAEDIRKLGKELNVPVVDLTAKTRDKYDELGVEETANLHAWSAAKKPDNTHLNAYGAQVVAQILATELAKLTDLDLATHIAPGQVPPDKTTQLVQNPNWVDPATLPYAPPTEQSKQCEPYVAGKATFYGTAIGDLSGGASASNHIRETTADGKMRIAVLNSKGKISASGDGIVMYYYPVPAGKTFTLTAKAHINDINATASNHHQGGFGLMARDDMYIDQSTKNEGLTVNGNYVTAGCLGDGSGVNFYRMDTTLNKNSSLSLAKPVAKGGDYELSIVRSVDGNYACSIDGVSFTFDQSLDATDTEYTYVGMFCARIMDVTYSDIKLIVDGVELTGGTDTPTTPTDTPTTPTDTPTTPTDTPTTPGETTDAVAGGGLETLFAELPGVKAADVTAVKYSGAMTGALAGDDLKFLVRDVDGKVRIDIPGVKAGKYTLTVTAKGKDYTAENVEVQAHDRSGFAHYNYTEGVGAYKDDGTLKDNAVVLYVTDQNKDTVTLTVGDATLSGIGNILNTAGYKTNGANGGQAPKILQELSRANKPLVIRILGTVNAPKGVSPFVKGSSNGGMCFMKYAKNVTVEGIGPDATIKGWGVSFSGDAADATNSNFGKNFEVRNLSFKEVPEDCVEVTGNANGDGTIREPVSHAWVHNCAFYRPTDIANPAESDKAQGDGALDFKSGQYMTSSYNYFQGYHKTSLVGSDDKCQQYHVTWHHNYWKDCEQRMPLGRQADMHIYNNLYELDQANTSKGTWYGMSLRANVYVFSENNTFLKVKNPVIDEGSGGVCKSFGDVFTDCTGTNDAKIVAAKSETVTSANKFANFDTQADSYVAKGAYKLDSVADAKKSIETFGGVMKTAGKMTTVAMTATGGDKPTQPSDQPSDQPSAAPVAVTGVKLDKTTAKLKVNGTVTLKATVSPSDAANKAVTWASDNTYVVSVDTNGKVVANHEGTAKVTVTTVDGGKTASCTVTVSNTTTPPATGGGGGRPVTQPTAAPSAQPTDQPSAAPDAPVDIDVDKPASENFGDVVKDSWYESGVTYVVKKGLFRGVAQGVFAPQQDMTRAMLMTVLARLDGQDTTGGDTWYAKGQAWALEKNISDGTMLDMSVTREQMVAMLYRYAKPETAEGDLSAFADGERVADWAKDAMTWAVANGILTGKDGGRLDPQGTATRAEVATILQRFVEKTGK